MVEFGHIQLGVMMGFICATEEGMTKTVRNVCGFSTALRTVSVFIAEEFLLFLQISFPC